MQLIVEALFIEAALRLIGTDPSAIPATQLKELERLAFDWILHGEIYVDNEYPQLHRLRDRVVLAASRLIGSLSSMCLDSITDRFLKELTLRIKSDASSSSRQEIYALCHGLRFVRFCDDTSALLRSATHFLESAHPMKHVAPERKSRLQQALADMLTSILGPLADSSNPGSFGATCDPELQRQWHATITMIRTDILRWTTKQAKQVFAGLPAVTVLTCLEEEPALVSSIDSLVEYLHRQLKEKSHRTMALLCLVRCISSFVRRVDARGDNERLEKWISRSVTPVVQAMIKGQLLTPEHHELLRQLCTVIAWQLPEFAIKDMVLEMLQSDGISGQCWECSMAGLASLASILGEAPARLAGRAPVCELPATPAALEASVTSTWTANATIRMPPREICDQLLEIVKLGRHPLEAYGVGHLVPLVSAAVGHLLGQCHQLHGFSNLTNAPRMASDTGVRERLGALPVFVSVLHITPYLLPEGWRAGGIADDLPGYTIHVEPSVRSAAIAALQRCLIALPSARDTLVCGMALFIVRLKEDFVDVIRESLELLLDTMWDWNQLIAIETARSLAAGEPSGPSHTMLGSLIDISQIEGASIALMCSTDVRIRALAVEIARAARDIHRVLLSSPLCRDNVAAAGAAGGVFSNIQQQQSYAGDGGSSVYRSSSASQSRSAVTAATGGGDGASLSSANTTAHTTALSPRTRSISSSHHHPQQQQQSNPLSILTSSSHSHSHSESLTQSSSHLHHSQHQQHRHAHHLSFQHGSSHHRHVRQSSATTSISSGMLYASQSSDPRVNATAAKPSSVPGTPCSYADDSLMPQSMGVSFLADIIDFTGDDVLRASYWDIGPWSDMWRAWRPIPQNINFFDCMCRDATGEDIVRWVRVLLQLARTSWSRCKKSALCAHIEVTAKLQAMLAIDTQGRQVLPHEGPRNRLAKAYLMVLAAAPLLDHAVFGDRGGLTARELVRILLAGTRSGIDMAGLALGCMHPSCHTIVVLECGYLGEDPTVSGGVGGGGGSGIGGGGGHGAGRSTVGRGGVRLRRDDSRLLYAHILRLLSSNLPPDSLLHNITLREKLVEFVADTARLVSLLADISIEAMQLRYCLCIVATHVAMQLSESMPNAFPPMIRKQLFDRGSIYCEEGPTAGLFRSELRQHIAAAKAASKGRDAEALKYAEMELMDASDMLEKAGIVSMAAMLAGPLFDGDARDPGGRVFTWIDKMLTGRESVEAAIAGGGGGMEVGPRAWGPPKDHVARIALGNMLLSNHDLTPVFVDRCYVGSKHVSRSYFLVLSEAYVAAPLPMEDHVAVSLVLHKVVDDVPAVRDAARAMLTALTRRSWNRRPPSSSMSRPSSSTGSIHTANVGAFPQPSPEPSEDSSVKGAIVIGTLAESHRAFQQHLSSTLAKDHAELAHAVTMEILARHHHATAMSGAPSDGASSESEVDALACLSPWLEYASFGRQGDGQWATGVLRALYAVTAQQGSRKVYPVQELWATVASNRRNIMPTLDFLLKQGLLEASAAARRATSQQQHGQQSNIRAANEAASIRDVDQAVQASCAVGKQIALYLSRVAPRQTIDHLAYEAAQQLLALDEQQAQKAKASSSQHVSLYGDVGSGRSSLMGRDSVNVPIMVIIVIYCCRCCCC